ncbi:hypothetical protein Tco_0572631 [Tanacetum coccineum]
MPPKRRTARTTPATTTTPTTTVTNAQLQALIDQGVAAALAERDASRSRDGNNSHGSGTGGRRQVPTQRECTYTDFLKCQPINFKGTEGFVGLTQWAEKMESVFLINNCAITSQVKYASCTLQGYALTWWNSHVRAVGQDVAYTMPWTALKRMITDKYCPRGEIKKLESNSSPVKTSDNLEKFADELAPLDSLPPGNDDSTLKKDFHKNDKDAEIESSSFTLTSPEESEFEAYLEIDSIPPGIDLTLPPTLEVSSSNPTSPTLTGEKVCSWKTPMFFSLVRFVWKMMTRIAIRKKIICLLATYLHQKPKLLSRPQEVEEIKEKEDKVSSDVPIHTIVMPIRITFDNPIDFNDHFSKPKDFKKDLTVSFDSSESSILPSPLLDSDSPFTAELSASVTLNSLGNEDKVFKPGILVYHAIHDKNLVTLEENLKENISSGTLLVFKEPSFLLPPPEPPDKCLNFEPILVMKNVVLNEAFYQSNVDDVNSFTIIIWIFLPYFPYTKESPLIFSFRSENFVFDPGIVTFHHLVD